MRPRATSVTTCRYWRASPAHHLRITGRRPRPQFSVSLGCDQRPLQTPRVRHPIEIERRGRGGRPADVYIGSQSHPSTNHLEMDCPAALSTISIWEHRAPRLGRSAARRIVLGAGYPSLTLSSSLWGAPEAALRPWFSQR
jgi:hypothetical protein